jgi:hypothetical protein
MLQAHIPIHQLPAASCQSNKPQAASYKRQAASFKLQAMQKEVGSKAL